MRRSYSQDWAARPGASRPGSRGQGRHRYADRLNEAAGMTEATDDAAKTRPDDDEDEQDEE